MSAKNQVFLFPPRQQKSALVLPRPPPPCQQKLANQKILEMFEQQNYRQQNFIIAGSSHLRPTVVWYLYLKIIAPAACTPL